MISRNKFRKSERLNSQKEIQCLFRDGASFFNYPYRVYWLQRQDEAPDPVRILVSVPKRLHKRANQRNLIRRRIKEAYRINKYQFYKQLAEHKIKISLVLVYTSKETEPFLLMERKILLAMERLLKELGKK